MGEILRIPVGEHIFETPEIPTRKEILFSDKKKVDQYWRRKDAIADLPKFFYEWNEHVEEEAEFTIYSGKKLISLSVADTKTLRFYRDRELYRRIHGVWFMNKDIPTYLTGNHYFNLVWFAMTGVENYVEEGSSYGMYMKFQRDFFYFYEICKHTKYGRGGMVVKPKKTAVTMAMSSICLNEGSLKKQKLIRMMSTKQKDANKSCFRYIDFAIQKMPTVLTPAIANWNTFAVIFDMPEKKNSKAATKLRETTTEYLATEITTVATGNDSFDTLTNYIAWVDEFTKISETANPKELHEVTIDTVMLGSSRRGTIMYTNYTQEFNDDSFEEGRQIFLDSYLRTVDEATGMTKSKLICYTMLEQHGKFGEPVDGRMTMVDKYGDPNEAEILSDLNQQLNQIKSNPSKVQGFMRRHPTEESHPWMEAGGELQMFDVLRISMQLQQIDLDESMGVVPYDFNLEFETQPKRIDTASPLCEFSGKIKIKTFTNEEKMKGNFGRFMWYDKQWTPDEWLAKHLNNLAIDRNNKRLKPRLDTPFFAVVDPTNFSLKKDIVVGSKNAIQVFVLPDQYLNGLFGENVTNKRLMAEYLFRHDKPHDTLMDAIKVVLLFGCYILIESNMPWLATQMIEMGLGNFVLMVNKETGILEPYNRSGNQQYFTSQTQTIGKYFIAGVHHLKEPEVQGDLDNIKYIKSPSVLKQLLKIKPEDTTKYDAAVCYLEGLYGMEWFYGWREGQLKKDRPGDPARRQLALGILR